MYDMSKLLKKNEAINLLSVVPDEQYLNSLSCFFIPSVLRGCGRLDIFELLHTHYVSRNRQTRSYALSLFLP